MSQPAASPLLTHRCPRLNASFNGSGPCERNQERAEALLEAGKWTGHLHHCLECQGRDLEAIEVEQTTTEHDAGQHDVAQRGEYCKNHPEVKSHQNKNGRPMGLCLDCLRERAAANSRNRKGRVQPETINETRKESNVAVPLKLTEQEAERILGKDRVAMLAPEKPSEPSMCTKHNKPIKFNSKGFSMGGCEDCRAEISSRGGKLSTIENQLFIDYPELLTWVEQEAKEQVRTVRQQVVFYVLQAQKRATGKTIEV